MLTLCSPFNFFIKGYGMIFKPQIWINSVLDIDEDFLDKYNIKALVLDLDNTLSMHGNPGRKRHTRVAPAYEKHRSADAHSVE